MSEWEPLSRRIGGSPWVIDEVVKLEEKVAKLEEERKVVEDYCWSKAGGEISVAGTIFRYLSEGIKIP